MWARLRWPLSMRTATASLYAGVCWCPAETRTGLLSALATLAVTVGAATAEEADVEKAAKAALRRLAEQRATWLLVYDNVSRPEDIADLLPSAGARVLITSRFSEWSELAEEVALDVLPLEEAVALLESRTGRSDAAGAKTLAEALGRLPLALDHAAAYCKTHADELRRLCGEGVEPHCRSTAWSRLSQERRRDLRPRHCRGRDAVSSGGSAHGVSWPSARPSASQ